MERSDPKVGFFDIEDARLHGRLKESVGMTISQDLVNPVAADADAEAFDQQDQECGPRSWAALQTQEQAEAFLATASEEVLRAMAERLLGGHPVSHAEAVPQRLIALALFASGELSRRVTRAVSGDQTLKFRWRPAESDRGNRS